MKDDPEPHPVAWMIIGTAPDREDMSVPWSQCLSMQRMATSLAATVVTAAITANRAIIVTTTAEMIDRHVHTLLATRFSQH